MPAVTAAERPRKVGVVGAVMVMANRIAGVDVLVMQPAVGVRADEPRRLAVDVDHAEAPRPASVRGARYQRRSARWLRQPLYCRRRRGRERGKRREGGKGDQGSHGVFLLGIRPEQHQYRARATPAAYPLATESTAGCRQR